MGSERSGCTASLMGAVAFFERKGIRTFARILDYADIVKSRNVLASAFLARKESHLLFVDADIGFKTRTLQRMEQEDAPFVGCVYPKRNGQGFAVHHGNTINIVNGAADVNGLGMGLCLLSRAVFETLVSKVRKGPPEPVFKVSGPIYGFFDQLLSGKDLMPEDLSFCRRWRESGGKVRALLNEEISHIGDHAHRRNYLDHLKSSPSRVTETR